MTDEFIYNLIKQPISEEQHRLMEEMKVLDAKPILNNEDAERAFSIIFTLTEDDHSNPEQPKYSLQSKRDMLKKHLHVKEQADYQYEEHKEKVIASILQAIKVLDKAIEFTEITPAKRRAPVGDRINYDAELQGYANVIAREIYEQEKQWPKNKEIVAQRIISRCLAKQSRDPTKDLQVSTVVKRIRKKWGPKR